MKYFINLTKTLVIFFFIALSINLKSQTPLTFNNNTGNHKFSDIGNWETSTGAAAPSFPGPNDKIKIATVNMMLYLDGSFQVKQIQSGRKGVKVTTKRDVFIHLTAAGNQNYIFNDTTYGFNNADDPELNFYYGEKIHFVMTDPSLATHPLEISNITAGIDISGIINNNTTGDTVIFDTSIFPKEMFRGDGTENSANPVNLRYFCSNPNHPNMVGDIIVHAPPGLTLTGAGGVNQVVQANGDDAEIEFEVPVYITAGAADNDLKQIAVNGLRSKIIFNDGLYPNKIIALRNNQNKANTSHVINGYYGIVGNTTSKLQIDKTVNATFGPQSDFTNTNQDFYIQFTGTSDNANLIIETDESKSLKNGSSLTFLAGATVSVNSENSLKSILNTTLEDVTLNLNINENQEYGSEISMTDTSKINLTISSLVDTVAFTDNSSADWGQGLITITGFRENLISFGTTSTGLTAQQLSQFDIGGSNVLISNTGHLLYETPPDVAISTFTNASGDKLWSNTQNWSNGIPNVPSAIVTVEDTLIIDTNVAISQLKVASTNVDSIIIYSTNNSTLEINGDNVTQPIQNNMTGASLTLDLGVNITSNDLETIMINGGSNASINFGPNSVLNPSSHLKFIGKVDRSFTFDGILQMDSVIQVGDGTDLIFGPNSNNSPFNGEFQFLGANSRITVNTQDNGTFLPAGIKLSPGAASNASIVVNGANTLMGDVNIDDKDFTVSIKANQDNVGTITMGSGNMKLNLDASVGNLSFADNSSSDWGSGKLIINGFINDVIRFGNDSTGLTKSQLDSIDIGGGAVVIDENGYISSLVVSQSTFTNSSGDKLWSNDNNWSNGIPNVEYAKVTLNDSLIIDRNVEIAQIKLSDGFGEVHVSSIGDSLLTLNGSSVGSVIQNNATDTDLRFELSVIIESSDSDEQIQVNGGGNSRIIFREGSKLTSDVLLKIEAIGDKYVLFNDSLISSTFSYGMVVKPNSKVVLGQNADLSEFYTAYDLMGNAELISRTPNENAFNFIDFPIKSLGASNTQNPNVVSVDNGYTLQGGIQVDSVNLVLNLHEQQHINYIELNAANLTINLLDTTDNGNSSLPKGGLITTGDSVKLYINGLVDGPYKNNSFRIGIDSTGASPAQLNRIIANDTSSVGIDSFGFLYIILDADDDGVVDSLDVCPNTPAGESVDSEGCSLSQKDTDGDGVTDDIDACPETPAGATVDATGCEIPLIIESKKLYNNVYPNPASSFISVELKDDLQIDDIYFVDINGKILNPKSYRKNRKLIDVDISNINEGIYIMDIRTIDSNIIRIKAIIRR